jgi:outer membrane protein assembly factor BamB
MLKSSRQGLVWLTGLAILCTVRGGFSAEGGSPRLVSAELLEHAHLKIVWENELPIKKAESVDRMFLLANRIYVISDRNYVLSLNKQNGKIAFGKTVAPAGLLISGMMLYGDELLYVNGSSLVRIDAESGLERKTIDIGQGMTCPATRNGSYFYAAGVDKRLHALRVENMVQAFEVAADNNSVITSILADEGFVVFTTDKGNVICIAPNRAVRLWQFDAAGAVAGPVVRDWMSLYFASKDMNVYRIDMTEQPGGKQLVWKYQAAGMLEEAPRVTQSVVYQHVRGKGVVAIDKQTGSSIWSVPRGDDLLAEAGGRAYVITDTATLVVMDNAKAEKLYSVNFAGVSKHAANAMDDKIYIADKHGRIACLQPVQ